MPMTSEQMAVTVAVAIAGTVITRFLPYVVFSEGRPVPQTVRYLGQVLPAAVFGLLVVYCLRNVDVLGGSHGIPEAVSLAVAAALYPWRRDMLVPMAGATACYMVLIRVLGA